MKIAIIGPAHPYRGGIANFSERLAQEFKDNDDIIDLYTFKMMYPNFLFPGQSQYAETNLKYNLNIYKIINSINIFNWYKVGKLISKQNYDIVLIAYSIPFLAPCLGTIARIIKRNSTTNIIALTHNLIPHEKRIGDNIFSNYFVNSCDAYITLSNKVKNDILTINQDAKIEVAVHPIYDTFGDSLDKTISRNKLNLDINKKYILFFGLIRHYKGLDLLIEAMPAIIEFDTNIQLIIAGEFYEDIEKYKDLISKNKLDKNIIIYNSFIPENEVNQYFCASNIVVQPYRNATQSGVTQICYHFNKPMIVTNVGGLPEHVPDGKVGFVCEPNTESIATAIIRFFNEDKEEYFIENIKLEKNKYSWSVLVNTIKNILK